MLLEGNFEIYAVKIWLKTLKKKKVRRWWRNGCLIKVFCGRWWFGPNGLALRPIRKGPIAAGGAAKISFIRNGKRAAYQVAQWNTYVERSSYVLIDLIRHREYKFHSG